MEAYNLKSRFGVQVDYWSNTYNAYFICDNIFSHNSSQTSKKSWSNNSGGQKSGDQLEVPMRLNSNNNSSQSYVKHLINSDDLMQTDTGKELHLRFKNCTGNEIILSKETIEEVDPSEQLTSQIALSIDYQFKNQRHRTVD